MAFPRQSPIGQRGRRIVWGSRFLSNWGTIDFQNRKIGVRISVTLTEFGDLKLDDSTCISNPEIRNLRLDWLHYCVVVQFAISDFGI